MQFLCADMLQVIISNKRKNLASKKVKKIQKTFVSLFQIKKEIVEQKRMEMTEHHALQEKILWYIYNKIIKIEHETNKILYFKLTST